MEATKIISIHSTPLMFVKSTAKCKLVLKIIMHLFHNNKVIDLQ